MTAPTGGENLTQEDSSWSWEADSWRFPPGVTGVFYGPTGVRLGIRDEDGQLWHGVDGRRAPVVGRIRRLDDGEHVIVPVNRGARRADDRALLDSVADLFEKRAAIPRSGRRGADRALRWIAAQERTGVPRPKAIEKAAMRAAIPRSGRRRDGVADRACRWIAAQEADGVPRAKAVENLAKVIGWKPHSMQREYRRWRLRGRFGYRFAAQDGAKR